MKLHDKFSRLLTGTLVVLGIAFGLFSCEKKEQGGNLTLYYMGVSNIGPGMLFTSNAPQYQGAKPSDFSLTAIKLDGEKVQAEGFSVDPQTGVVTIAKGNTLVPGEYYLTVSCMAGSKGFTFEDVMFINMMPGAPAQVRFRTPVLSFPYGQQSGIKVELESTSESVTVTGFSLKQEDGKEYFAIDSRTGTVTISKDWPGNVPAGRHNVIVGLATPSGTAYYDDVLIIDVMSAPLNLTYTPAFGKLELRWAYATATPYMEGSPDDMVYAIKAINPATDQIKINTQNGVIYTEQHHTMTENTYQVSVSVSNKYGAKDFDNVYSMEVVTEIKAIANFSYADQSVLFASVISAEKNAAFEGDEVKFEFVGLPAKLSDLKIDTNTGKITARKGNSIPVGDHSITVKATNPKGEASATLSLTVEQNPNFFSQVKYGNNLGLVGDNYAYQYAVEPAGLNIPAPTTDATVSVEYEKSGIGIFNSTAGNTITVNADGSIDVSANTIASGNSMVGYVNVKAVTGKGTTSEYSVVTPVFFNFRNVGRLEKVYFVPFVSKINPMTGGYSEPIIVEDTDMSLFKIDFRRTLDYKDFVDNTRSGRPDNAGQQALLVRVWEAYFGNMSSGGSKDPVSFYATPGRLADKAGYLEPSDQGIRFKVNPGKFKDNMGVYANGVFSGEMTYVLDGNEGNINTGIKARPLLIWFSEEF